MYSQPQTPAPTQTPVYVQNTTASVASALISAGLVVAVYQLGKTVGTLKERIRQQYVTHHEAS